MNRKKFLIVFGTRPEALKLIPLIRELKKEFVVKICITSQHKELLKQVLDLFDIKVDYDLDLMKKNQTLYDITANILLKLQSILDDFQPNYVVVHGDTTTTFSASLASFYKKIDVIHIEAGLRSQNLYSPYPEEANRKLTSILAKYHFCPTKLNQENLLKENISKNVFVVGNTIIDTLFMVLEEIDNNKTLKSKIENSLKNYLNLDKKFILVTGHRRENFGDGFLNICKALKILALKYPDIDIIYPLHLNPNVQEPVKKLLGEIKNIYLIPPLNYEEFIYLMSKSYLILTDSGGIQEEAPALNKPVLVMREVTERVEGLENGTLKLVGTDFQKIVNETSKLLEDKDEYQKMVKAINPYGDGNTVKKIVEVLKNVS